MVDFWSHAQRIVNVLCSSFKMAYMNAISRTVRSSIFSLSIRCINKQITFKVCSQFSQCRMLTLNHCLRSQNKPTSTESLNLDSWKDNLQITKQSPADQDESDTQEDTQEDLETLQKLIDMWRIAGKTVPNSISTEKLQEFLKLPSKTSLLKALRELKHKELRQEHWKKKKLEKQTEREKTSSEMKGETENLSKYIMKIYFSNMDNCYGWRNVQAMIHGPSLVFDMVYDQYMSKKEIENTVSQLIMSVGFNKTAAEPFHIHFCNLQPDGPYHKELVNCYQGAWDKILITTTEKSHIHIFPRDQLVYLTADSPNVIKEFDPDKIYIVGAFVDKCQKPGVSLGIAKRLKIATARLPIDKYLKLNTGAKNLTLDQMTEILMTLKDTGDWKSALSFVPQRKHSGFIEYPFPKKVQPSEGRRTGGAQYTRSNAVNKKKAEWQEKQS